MDKVKEFIEDLKQNWDNSYWWADHQWLMMLFVMAGYFIYEVGTEYTKLTMRARLGGQ